MLQTKENAAPNLLMTFGFQAQTAADATYIEGAILDRCANAYAMPQSCLGIISTAFTTATGGAGDLNTLTVVVEHGDNSGLSDKADLDSDTYVYTWLDNGANYGQHAIPVDLSAAKRYIRLKAKLTVTDVSKTIVISDQTLCGTLILSGMGIIPSSSYAAAGYESTTEPPAP